MDTTLPLISVAELAATPAAEILIADCRFALSDPDQGERDYRAGHIPQALYANLDKDLSDLQQTGLGRHPLPAPQDFVQTLRRWGWHPTKTVIAYDAGNGAMAAARLFWLVRFMGGTARVLDGGLAAWQAAGQAVEKGAPASVSQTQLTLTFDEQRVVYTPQLRTLLDAHSICLIDARGAARYSGEQEPLDPRAGHVPGAVNRPFAQNMDADTGLWKTPAQLRTEFAELIGPRDSHAVVHMCGSGVTACHNYLAMEVAGLHGSRLYAPSWSGWSSDAQNPVATGSAP